jgi:hypothetical protein
MRHGYVINGYEKIRVDELWQFLLMCNIPKNLGCVLRNDTSFLESWNRFKVINIYFASEYAFLVGIVKMIIKKDEIIMISFLMI